LLVRGFHASVEQLLLVLSLFCFWADETLTGKHWVGRVVFHNENSELATRGGAAASRARSRVAGHQSGGMGSDLVLGAGLNLKTRLNPRYAPR
jgi:hypothetical protein